MTTETEKLVTLEDALKAGAVVSKESIKEMVAKEFDLAKDDLKKSLRKEIIKENRKKEQDRADENISSLMKGTGLTNKKFCCRLRRLNMPKRYWEYLRDEHHNLSDIQLWDYIRQEVK